MAIYISLLITKIVMQITYALCIYVADRGVCTQQYLRIYTISTYNIRLNFLHKCIATYFYLLNKYVCVRACIAHTIFFAIMKHLFTKIQSHIIKYCNTLKHSIQYDICVCSYYCSSNRGYQGFRIHPLF